MVDAIEPAMRPLVDAIRADAEVGTDSMSVIDECWTDEELVDMLARRGITAPGAAVDECREIDRLYREREQEVRSFIF